MRVARALQICTARVTDEFFGCAIVSLRESKAYEALESLIGFLKHYCEMERAAGAELAFYPDASSHEANQA